MISMKIYAIYRTDLEESVLYAVSDNKSLVDEFMAIRDKKKFMVGAMKTPKHNGLKFLDDHSSMILTRTEFKTNGDFGISTIELVVTRGEEETVLLRGDEILVEELSKYVFDGEIFTPDVQKALYELEFFKIFKFKNSNKYAELLYYCGIPEVESDIYSLRCDELMMFIHKFGWSMSPKQLKKKGK